MDFFMGEIKVFSHAVLRELLRQIPFKSDTVESLVGTKSQSLSAYERLKKEKHKEVKCASDDFKSESNLLV